ncbi:rod shape-determining protein MreD [Candidatus Margulisiibacteriota bacterium]
MNLLKSINISKILVVGIILFVINSLPVWGWFRQFGVIPNLLVVYLSITAFEEGVKAGLKWGIIFGLLIDLSSGVFFVNTLILPLTGLIIGSIRNDIFRKDQFVIIFVVGLGTILWTLGYAFIAPIVFDQVFVFRISSILILLVFHSLLTPLVRLLRL